jgi:hypothetical protein
VYEAWLFLHILCVILGYGAVALDLLYTNQIRRFSGAEAHAVAAANWAVSHKFAEWALYGVPVFGLLIALDADISLGSPWLSASFLVYLLSLALLHGLVNPARRQALVLLGELAGVRPGSGRPAQATELGRLGRMMSLGQTLFSLLGAIALALMIWQPGGNS